MKLIPPDVAEAAPPKTDIPVIQPAQDIVEAREKVKVLAVVDREVKSFTKSLGKVIDRLEDLPIMTPALMLASLLNGMGTMLESLESWAQNAQGGENGDGYAGSGSATGAGIRKNRGRPRKSDIALAAAAGADGQPVKRGRGRPKGSKNKPKPATGDFKQQLRDSLKAGKRKRPAVARRRKSVVRKSVAKRPVKRPAAAKRKSAVKRPVVRSIKRALKQAVNINKAKARPARKSSTERGSKPAARKATRKR